MLLGQQTVFPAPNQADGDAEIVAVQRTAITVNPYANLEWSAGPIEHGGLDADRKLLAHVLEWAGGKP